VNHRDNVRDSNSDPRIDEPAEITNIPSPSDAPSQPLPIQERDASADLRTVKRAVLVVLLLLVLGIFYVAQEVLIPLTLALLLSLLLSPVVTLLQRARLPRAVGSILVLVVVVVALAGGVTLLSQPARDWIAKAPATIQTIQQRFRSFREPIRRAEEATKKLENLTQSGTQPTVVSTEPSLLTSMATGTPRVLASIAAVLLLVYFFLSSGNGFLRRMVEIAPGLTEKKQVVSIARDVQDEMSRYLLMVTLINIAVGALTALTMTLLGVPNPLLWGAAAGVLNFAPYVGPAMTGVIAGRRFHDIRHTWSCCCRARRVFRYRLCRRSIDHPDHYRSTASIGSYCGLRLATVVGVIMGNRRSPASRSPASMLQNRLPARRCTQIRGRADR
jgi:predicted PurR-regulated permease PerM